MLQSHNLFCTAKLHYPDWSSIFHRLNCELLFIVAKNPIPSQDDFFITGNIEKNKLLNNGYIIEVQFHGLFERRQYTVRYLHFSTSIFWMCYCIVTYHQRLNSGKDKKGIAHEVLHRMFLESFNIHRWLHRRDGIQAEPYKMVKFWLINEVTISYTSDRLCIFVGFCCCCHVRFEISNKQHLLKSSKKEK